MAALSTVDHVEQSLQLYLGHQDWEAKRSFESFECSDSDDEVDVEEVNEVNSDERKKTIMEDVRVLQEIIERFKELAPDGTECGCLKAIALLKPGK